MLGSGGFGGLLTCTPRSRCWWGCWERCLPVASDVVWASSKHDVRAPRVSSSGRTPRGSRALSVTCHTASLWLHSSDHEVTKTCHLAPSREREICLCFSLGKLLEMYLSSFLQNTPCQNTDEAGPSPGRTVCPGPQHGCLPSPQSACSPCGMCLLPMRAVRQ